MIVTLGFVFVVALCHNGINGDVIPTKKTPLLVLTWDNPEAAVAGWNILNQPNKTAVDGVVATANKCEETQCKFTVGYGGSPDEEGETTLDAMIMDGNTMNVGAVGGLRRIKDAILVARKVLENTRHSFLGGDLATEFALKMGFKEESLSTKYSTELHRRWKAEKCQPNFWMNVNPDPTESCGLYSQIEQSQTPNLSSNPAVGEDNHDTIGVIGMDVNGGIAAGTSTNGAGFKIHGRIGDSPIPGSGAYADAEVGAAAETGDGDIMMRFAPTFFAVEQMRNGATPTEAAKAAIARITKHYRKFAGAIIALDKHGNYGAACNGLGTFPFFVVNPVLGKPQRITIDCTNVLVPGLSDITYGAKRL